VLWRAPTRSASPAPSSSAGWPGKIDVAEVIVYCPWEANGMAVSDLLMSQRRWGETRCHKLLARLPVSEQKTVGSMTDRQSPSQLNLTVMAIAHSSEIK
jgi:hypothetical protein